MPEPKLFVLYLLPPNDEPLVLGVYADLTDAHRGVTVADGWERDHGEDLWRANVITGTMQARIAHVGYVP